MKTLELRVPPVALWLVAAALMWGIARLLPGATVSLPGLSIVAVVLAAAAIAVAAAGVIEFRRRGTTVHPGRPEGVSAFVSGGIFRRTRNPMYVGLALLLTAWGIHLGNFAALVVVLPLFVAWLTRFQILPEERVLVERFGHEYAAYAMRVRRWV